MECRSRDRNSHLLPNMLRCTRTVTSAKRYEVHTPRVEQPSQKADPTMPHPTSTDLVIGKMPDPTRPVLFLDFDGVINLGGHCTPPEGETRRMIHKWRAIPREGEWESFVCDKIFFSYYQEVADALRDLNCVWITSWKDLTQSKLNPMLGYDFGYVDLRYRGPSDFGSHGKMLYIGEVVKELGIKEYVVCDDDLSDAGRWLSQDTGVKGTVIAPDPEIGLTAKDCARIRRIMREE